MDIQFITVGKLKGGFKYIQPGIDDYLKRLRSYCKVEIIEVPDETITSTRPPEQVMAKEAERLQPYIDRAAVVVALSERGKAIDSEAFSRMLFDRLNLSGKSTNPSNGGRLNPGSESMIFLVGGALGLAPSILNQADWILSLSPLTFPHPLVRLIFLEQLYRAFKIIRNEPYHK